MPDFPPDWMVREFMADHISDQDLRIQALEQELAATRRAWALTVLRAMLGSDVDIWLPLIIPLLPPEVSALVTRGKGCPISTCEQCGETAPLRGWVIQAPGSPENRCVWKCGEP